MVWLFLFIVLGLSCSYVMGGGHHQHDIKIKNSESFIVTAILSTLAAHGILSLMEENELQNATLEDLQDTLIGNGLVDKAGWEHLLTEHLNDSPILSDYNDIDLG
ncbi:hypothetical protein HF072_21170 [Bacillus sp. RO3]|nr:hypothetical protein [Bacillus sp. RO3]